jgi:8-oxo-dGTP diphosphatase
MNKLFFYLLWPLLWFYAPLTRRVRVIIINENKVLLVKNSFGPGVFQFPGGGIKFKESVKSAAVREVHEELGVTITNPRLLHEGFLISKQYGLIYKIHYLSAAIGDSELKTNHEILEYSWVSPNDLKDVSTEVVTGLKLVEKDS